MSKEREREALRLVRPMNRKLNEVRFSPGESKEHVLAKKVICQYLKAIGKDFLTEAIFVTGGRPDIFILSDFVCVEIMKSESHESIVEKANCYPNGLKIIKIEVS